MMLWLTGLIGSLAGMGFWGMVLFVLLYCLSAVTLAPSFLLTVAAGAIYGVVRGSIVVFVGASLGGSLSYAVATRLAQTRLLRRLDREPRVIVVRNAVQGDSLWVQFLLRLSPIVPFTLLNYALGLARVRFRDFAGALVGMLPAIVMYTYYGRVVGDVAKLAAGVTPPRGAGYYTLLGIGVVATACATTLITRAARQALRPAPSQ